MSISVVFLPGIMGSELELPSGEVVWPPTVSEVVSGYHRIEELQDPSARATRIIPNVSCVKFYSPLQSLFKQLGFGDGGDRRLIEHPYDWRRDLFDLADGVAERLDGIDAEEIIIVAHSMGGLIGRLVLETGTYANRPWFTRISTFVAIATPHNGAPLALARVLGLDKALGISGEDFKRLSANADYPSGYQLLPAPGEDALWNTAGDAGLAPLDFYDPHVAAQIGLKPALVARAKALHDALRAGSAPAHVRYFYFSGAGHKTVTRINLDGDEAYVVLTPDAGDGTVPLWSALPRPEQKQVVINEHANVFRGTPFKRVLFRLFGADAGDPRELIKDGSDGSLHLSLQRSVFNAGEPIEAVIASEEPITQLDGRLVFDRITVGEVVERADAAVVDILYEGPGIQSFALTLKVTLDPGFYELRYDGSQPQAERVVFAVSQ